MKKERGMVCHGMVEVCEGALYAMGERGHMERHVKKGRRGGGGYGTVWYGACL